MYIVGVKVLLDKDSDIYKNGYSDGDTIDNTILDNRQASETTKRYALNYYISSSSIVSNVEFCKKIGSIAGGPFKLDCNAPLSNSNSNIGGRLT